MIAKEKIKPLSAEEKHTLLNGMLKLVHETPNDTKLGRKIRKLIIEFGVKKYNLNK